MVSNHLQLRPSNIRRLMASRVHSLWLVLRFSPGVNGPPIYRCFHLGHVFSWEFYHWGALFGVSQHFAGPLDIIPGKLVLEAHGALVRLLCVVTTLSSYAVGNVETTGDQAEPCDCPDYDAGDCTTTETFCPIIISRISRLAWSRGCRRAGRCRVLGDFWRFGGRGGIGSRYYRLRVSGLSPLTVGKTLLTVCFVFSVKLCIRVVAAWGL